MLNHNVWSAWISVDGQELPQYQTTVTEVPGLSTTHKVSCWIASDEGKAFSIHVQTKPGLGMVSPGDLSRINISIRMDGAAVTSSLLGPFRPKIDINGTRPNDQTEMPFLFSRLSLTDDDSASRDVSHLKDLGLISLRVERVLVSGYDRGFQSETVAEKGPIHEASKKAGAHCVSFGKPRPVASKTRSIIKHLGNPLVIFEFRYRSADMLRAQGIIPRVISSEPIEDLTAPRRPRRLPEATAGPLTLKRKVKQEADNEENVDAEINALKERLDALEGRRNKQNHSEGSVRPKKKAKVEPLDHSNVIDDEVIDLT